MPCEVENIDGVNFFFCHRGNGGGQKCYYCDRSSTRLCDFPIGGDSKTCDIPMCAFCTHKAGRNRDLCQAHRGQVAHQPRRDADAPRWMKAIYTGTCRLCFKTVYEGVKMLWFKREKKLYCEPCGKKILEEMKTV